MAPNLHSMGMKYFKPLLVALSLLFITNAGHAQKPFAEGTIIYNVKLVTTDNKSIKGKYTFTFKGGQIRKDLSLSNGYEDVLLINTNTGTAYSLQNRQNKKYAIELNMGELKLKQAQFRGFKLTNETANKDNVAGYAAYHGKVNYTNGTYGDIIYTKEWQPASQITFERFPEANFLPLKFSYNESTDVIMEFEAIQVVPGPIENAVFRIPTDYKMISNAEYKELTK